MTHWVNDWLTEWLTDWLTDCLTDWLTDCLTDWTTGWQTDWLTDWLTDCQTERLTDWQTDWLAGRHTDRPTDMIPTVYCRCTAVPHTKCSMRCVSQGDSSLWPSALLTLTPRRLNECGIPVLLIDESYPFFTAQQIPGRLRSGFISSPGSHVGGLPQLARLRWPGKRLAVK